MFRRLFVIAGLAALLSAALALPAGAATVSPSKWAPKFCNALTQWESTLKTEGAAASSAISGHAADLSAARDELVSYLGKSVDATQVAIRKVKQAGTPSSTNGAKIVTKLVAGFQGAAGVFSEAKVNAAALSTTDAAAFASAGTQIQTDLSAASDKITASFNNLPKLDAKNELSRALDKAAACKAVSG